MRSCIASASLGSSSPMLVLLKIFSVTRSNQLQCTISSSTCVVNIVNASTDSTSTYVEIAVGPVGSSASFQAGLLSSVVTVSANVLLL